MQYLLLMGFQTKVNNYQVFDKIKWHNFSCRFPLKALTESKIAQLKTLSRFVARLARNLSFNQINELLIILTFWDFFTAS